MNDTVNSLNEQAAEKAFSKQSAIFDQLYSSNIIIQYKRQRVRDHVSQYLKPNSRILELNAGTGDDAIWFGERGHKVHATDISKGMQEKLAEKVKRANLASEISTEIISFSELNQLQNR